MPLIPLLAACATVSDDTPGVVTSAGAGEVMIVGPKKHGKVAKPTQRMVEQAQEVCPSAIFHSAQPSLSGGDRFEYLFKC